MLAELACKTRWLGRVIWAPHLDIVGYSYLKKYPANAPQTSPRQFYLTILNPWFFVHFKYHLKEIYPSNESPPNYVCNPPPTLLPTTPFLHSDCGSPYANIVLVQDLNCDRVLATNAKDNLPVLTLLIAEHSRKSS